MATKPFIHRLAQAIADATRNAPDRDCANCEYRSAAWSDGAHCYFYREEPTSDKCAQFEPTTEGKDS